MKQKTSYTIKLFWSDQTPIETFDGTYTEEQILHFIFNKTIDKIKDLPRSMQESLLEKWQQK